VELRFTSASSPATGAASTSVAFVSGQLRRSSAAAQSRCSASKRWWRPLGRSPKTYQDNFELVVIRVMEAAGMLTAEDSEQAEFSLT